MSLTFGYKSVGALRKSRAHFLKRSAPVGARFGLAKCIPGYLLYFFIQMAGIKTLKGFKNGLFVIVGMLNIEQNGNTRNVIAHVTCMPLFSIFYLPL